MTATDPSPRPVRAAHVRASWIATGGFVLAALLGVAALLWWRPAPPPPASPKTASAPAPVAVAPKPPAPAAAEFEPASDRIPETSLPLRLVATVVRENHRLSLATVEDLQQGGHQVLSEGQSFRDHPDARVVAIERGRVLLDNAGVREQLVLDRGLEPPVAQADNAPTREQVESRRDMARRVRALTDAGENWREVRGGDVRGGLLAEGDINPVYDGDALVGLEVDGIRSGGVYDQMGLRDGDVVTSVNGVALSDPSAAAGVMAELAGSDKIVVSVERADGSEKELSMPTDEFANAVRQLP